jgi:uncharacterized short protein YbdD (DUF466 family)
MSAGVPAGVPGRIDRAWQFLRWYLRELSGEADYQRYVAQIQQLGTGAQPLSRRDFERRRSAELEGTVTNRCC